MLVTVFCAPRDRPEITFSLDVSPELEVRDFVALCELESGIPAGEIQISYAEQPLQDLTRALGAYGLKDGDVVVLRQAERRPPPQPAFPGLPRIDFSSIAVPGTSSARRPGSQQQRQSQTPAQQQQQPQQQQQQQQQQRSPPPPPPSLSGSASSPQGLDDPSLLRDMLLANPHELSLLKERNPPLAEALLSGDLERFTKVLLEQQQERARREQERIRLLTADPFDLEAQAKIEEDIRQHNIEENMTIAMEEAPESFGQVVMLYINCKVNGHPVKAFVDSGAQMTIMSQACAERCNIMRLVDRRWAGIAKGVGTQKIIGRVHLAQVQIEGDFLPCSFSILEDQPMDMLLGLDMLKRHQCSIDLKKSVLLIGTTGSETRFLPEAELPECARLAYGADSRDDARPEEIADRELAEALQRSVQESETEDGRTTSPPVPPHPLFTPPDKTPVSSSPDHPRNPALDRSKSAPASLLHPPPQGEATSGSSQSQPPFQGLPQPVPPALATPETADPGALSQAPPLHPVPPPPQFPTTSSAAFTTPPPEGAASALNTAAEESQPPTAMEVGVAAGEEGTSSELGPLPDPGFPARLVEQKLEEASTADAKNTPVSISGDPSGEQSENQTGGGAEMEGACLPPDAKLDPDLSLAPEPAPDSSSPSASAVESAADTQVIPRPERDQPEGERQPNCDSIPSLAAALMELHELLVSNRRMLSQEQSPAPSAPCREDADGVDAGSVAQSQTEIPGNAQPSATAAPAGDVECNSVDPHPAVSNGSSGHDGSADSGRVEVGQEDKPHPAELRESEVEGKLEEDAGGSEPEQAPLPQESLELREPPEGQQGRGVADGRAAAPDPPPFQVEGPSPMEVAPQSGPLTATGCAPVPAAENSAVPPCGACPLPPDTPPPPPHPLISRFPAAHIQRIQAAGFSAGEAAEALEQVQGHVELALLMLLARKITVPT